jgi:two-component system sensor histidine kinase DctS
MRRAPGAQQRWRWYAPRVASALIVVVLLGLLKVLHQHELDEHRAGLIRDVLWVEQNVQLSLDRVVDQLRELAHESRLADLDQAQLDVHVRHLLTGTPGLLQVVLLDARGALRVSVPAPAPGVAAHGSWIDEVNEPAYRLATGTGKAVYTPCRVVERERRFEVLVPYYRGDALAGTVVAVFGLKPMLAGLVPWWLAERHRVTLRDASGQVLAAKSNVEASGRPELTYQAPLDPPGQGLLLHVESYDAETNLVRNALAFTIVALAAAVLWSLWSLRRHVLRRNAMEEALRDEHAFRKAMEDSLETGMRAVDLEGRIVYVNPAFCRMVGFSEAELIGHAAPQPYWPPEDSARIEDAQRAARAAGARRIGIELELMRRGGERFDALLYEAPLVDARDRQTGWMASMVDITERKRFRQQQEKLAATARLVTMGEMASTLAHELNQPLSAIASYTTGCLNVLATGAAPPEELGEALRKAASQAKRAGEIVRRVHNVVRRSEPVRSRVRLNAVLEEALGFADPEARKRRVRVVSVPSPDDPELDADPVLLQQVLLNLLLNGMDAMAATPPEQRELLVSVDRDGEGVTVKVADRGCGLSPDVRRQLFEPFFSTKPEGMGMGLNICRSILELHGGRVWAEPNPGGGVVFSFSLPLGAA